MGKPTETDEGNDTVIKELKINNQTHSDTFDIENMISNLEKTGMTREAAVNVVLSLLTAELREGKWEKTSYFIVGSVGCFTLCWLTSIFLGMIAHGEQLEGVASLIMGGVITFAVKETYSRSLYNGTIAGYCIYLIALLYSCLKVPA